MCLLSQVLIPGVVTGADIVFSDGKALRGVSVVPGNGYVVLSLPQGSVRFPHSAIKTIDGKAPELFMAEEKTGAVPSVTVSAPEKVAEQPTKADEPIAPGHTESNPEDVSVATVEAAPKIDSPSISADETSPRTDSAPKVVEETEPGGEGTPVGIEVAMPKVSHSPVASIEQRVAASEHRWNMDLVLWGFLAVAGIWIYGLRWVQNDLENRGGFVRFWTMIALFLPGLGPLLYAGGRNIGRRRFATSKPPLPTKRGAAEPDKSGAFKFPWLPKRDPASIAPRRNNLGEDLEFLDLDKKPVSVGDGSVTSGLKYGREILKQAIEERASDVHIEPSADEYRVRFRLDGVMHERASYDTAAGRKLATALKSLAQIDVSERRKAQDGRFRGRIGTRDVDFRVATANSINGEKVVIRLLDHGSGIFDLATLGMGPEMLATFQSVIHSRNGMILATGPTGSGKTSTLYAALRQLDAQKLNIMTIEDPAEYELEGATQIAVNPKAGVTYESGLRSILRQDPDVILVGEMRDVEATEVALRAALTGHLMLSSLHTKDAVGTVSRLQEMGIERYQVASALLMIVAQRLVRVLCPECRKPFPAQGDELHAVGLGLEPGHIIYTAGGCDECMDTGYLGRTGIFELLVMDDDLRKALGEGLDEGALMALAEARGFCSYRYDGARKVLAGITTVEEVLQAV